ncbi:hypothetical protein [Ponticaulis profundi]|uniref:Sel1 repeat family protein n=1 Tax=Ponticaulis profundi TaxID=2665222 RepID=A0ABW1S844_9PROT
MAFSETQLESPCEELGPESAPEDLYRMGLVYSTGMGVATDYVKAHKWFNLAALRGYTEAKESRKELADYMSSEEIAEAQKAAREWLKLAH